MVRAKGVCFTDCAFLYDHTPRGESEEKTVHYLSDRRPEHNIYMGIPNALLGVDPLLDDAIARTTTIYSRTFWSLFPAFEFCQACQELARRSLNVDQLAIFVGPGGVGLYTPLI